MKKIVILGAGFGGLACAQSLNKYFNKDKELCKDYEILLIDRNDYQTYTPTLYEIATTSEETANLLELKTIVTFPLSYALWNKKVKFIQGEVIKIDVKEKKILLRMNVDLSADKHGSNSKNPLGDNYEFIRDNQREISENQQVIDFEYLVLALGNETNYFNIPGLKENSLPLKTLYNALKIRNAILALEHHSQENLKILIAGAGPTGVEFSGELSLWLKHLNKNKKWEITLIDGSKDILPGFSEKIVNLAKKRLAKLGIKIKTNFLITEVKENQVISNQGEVLNFDLLIWTGGVKAPEIVKEIFLKTEKKGVVVGEEMICLPLDEHLDLQNKIYALGDIACFYDPKTQKPLPGVARVAIEQAKVVAYNIVADIKNLSKKKYQPKEYPYILPIGGKWAIAKFGKILIVGFFGWILKGLVELYYLVSVLPLGMAISIWLHGLKIFIRND